LFCSHHCSTSWKPTLHVSRKRSWSRSERTGRRCLAAARTATAQTAAIGAVIPKTFVSAAVSAVDARKVAGVVFTNRDFCKRVGRADNAVRTAAGRRVVKHAGVSFLMEEGVALKPALKAVAHSLAVLRLRARIARASARFDAVIVHAFSAANVESSAALRRADAVYAFHKAVFGRSRTSLARGAAALRRIGALALPVRRKIAGDAGKRAFVCSAGTDLAQRNGIGRSFARRAARPQWSMPPVVEDTCRRTRESPRRTYICRRESTQVTLEWLFSSQLAIASSGSFLPSQFVSSPSQDSIEGVVRVARSVFAAGPPACRQRPSSPDRTACRRRKRKISVIADVCEFDSTSMCAWKRADFPSA
jgi:hypothetical protein